MIRANAYTNPETITIDSLMDFNAKSERCGWQVALNFRDKNEMKALQDALNRLYPENMRTIEEMPTEEGYYLSQTGTLLYCETAKDGNLWWSARRPTIDDGHSGTAPIEGFWDNGSSVEFVMWTTVVATLGTDAFPLVPVKFA